jgi:hypothetical protein
MGRIKVCGIPTQLLAAIVVAGIATLGLVLAWDGTAEASPAPNAFGGLDNCPTADSICTVADFETPIFSLSSGDCYAEHTIDYGDGSPVGTLFTQPSQRIVVNHTYKPTASTHYRPTDTMVIRGGPPDCTIGYTSKTDKWVGVYFPLWISSASFQDIDGQPLKFLSADDHSYFGGNTRIHGTITFTGLADRTSIKDISTWRCRTHLWPALRQELHCPPPLSSSF